MPSINKFFPGFKLLRADNQPQSVKPRCIGALEETSLTALIDYLADQQYGAMANLTEDVARQFCNHFNIETLTQLPAAQFDSAVQYLVEQMPPASASAEG